MVDWQRTVLRRTENGVIGSGAESSTTTTTENILELWARYHHSAM